MRYYFCFNVRHKGEDWVAKVSLRYHLQQIAEDVEFEEL